MNPEIPKCSFSEAKSWLREAASLAHIKLEFIEFLIFASDETKTFKVVLKYNCMLLLLNGRLLRLYFLKKCFQNGDLMHKIALLQRQRLC